MQRLDGFLDRLDRLLYSLDQRIVNKILDAVKKNYRADYCAVGNINSNYAWEIWNADDPSQKIRFYVKDFALYSTDNKLFMHVPRNMDFAKDDALVRGYADTLVRLVNRDLCLVFAQYWRIIQPRHIP